MQEGNINSEFGIRNSELREISSRRNSSHPAEVVVGLTCGRQRFVLSLKVRQIAFPGREGGPLAVDESEKLTAATKSD